MTLDPQAQNLLTQLAAAGNPPRHMMTISAARALSIASAAATNDPPEPVQAVENRTIEVGKLHIPIRIYTPTVSEISGPLPLLIYFHGGGWVLSNLDTHDSLCRKIANRARCLLISVDYRLAPEHKFPAAVEDCYAATLWAAEHAAEINGDAQRIAVGGDSVGGNLATVVALMARDRGTPPLIYQVLIYPVADYHTPGHPSYFELAEGYNLTRKDMIWFWRCYLRDEQDASNPYAVPMRAETLKGLPPAFVITAEYDPLRDEGEAYAQRLYQDGVPVALKRYQGMIHGFVNMSGVLDQGKQAIEEIAAVLRQAFKQ
jgi:acetyl esterase